MILVLVEVAAVGLVPLAPLLGIYCALRRVWP